MTVREVAENVIAAYLADNRELLAFYSEEIGPRQVLDSRFVATPDSAKVSSAFPNRVDVWDLHANPWTWELRREQVLLGAAYSIFEAAREVGSLEVSTEIEAGIRNEMSKCSEAVENYLKYGPDAFTRGEGQLAFDIGNAPERCLRSYQRVIAQYAMRNVAPPLLAATKQNEKLINQIARDTLSMVGDEIPELDGAFEAGTLDYLSCAGMFTILAGDESAAMSGELRRLANGWSALLVDEYHRRLQKMGFDQDKQDLAVRMWISAMLRVYKAKKVFSVEADRCLELGHALLPQKNEENDDPSPVYPETTANEGLSSANAGNVISDDLKCRFTVTRRLPAESEAVRVGFGEFGIKDSRIVDVSMAWLTKDQTTAAPFDGASLRITDNGSIVGRMTIFPWELSGSAVGMGGLVVRFRESDFLSSGDPPNGMALGSVRGVEVRLTAFDCKS